MPREVEPPAIVGTALKHVFDNLYVANTISRLRALVNPSDSDCKRWIYELLQDAKDSIAGDPDQKTVDVVLRVRDDVVEFKHNGSLFPADSRFALIYQ
jgi:hypothetical protein